jgi:hypothetical protein
MKHRHFPSTRSAKLVEKFLNKHAIAATGDRLLVELWTLTTIRTERDAGLALFVDADHERNLAVRAQHLSVMAEEGGGHGSRRNDISLGRECPKDEHSDAKANKKVNRLPDQPQGRRLVRRRPSLRHHGRRKIVHKVDGFGPKKERSSGSAYPHGSSTPTKRADPRIIHSHADRA